MIDFELEQPENWDKLVILGHSNESNKGDLTLDATIRLRAGYYLFKQKKVNKFILLGGGNDKIAEVSEADRMRDYLKENFNVSENLIETDNLGTNTLNNLSNFIHKFGIQNQNQFVFLTSDYNVVRVKLILELFGKPEIFVLSAEKILLATDDELKETIKNYLNSKQYQNRLLYENYWLAKTIYDENYTAKSRKEINILKSPVEYYQRQEKRLMENLEGEI